MNDTFGWAATNGAYLMLPAFGKRIEAIHYALSVVDGPWPPPPAPDRLTPERAKRWRKLKVKYSMSAVRVRVSVAFQEPTS